MYMVVLCRQKVCCMSRLRNTKDGIKPLLAKKWDISADGKTYTFHLRDDVKFHDDLMLKR